MVFRIPSSSTSSAYESFSSVGCKEFLIISVEDQVCLECIPGWESKSPEEGGHNDSIPPPLLPAQKTPLTSAVSKPSNIVDEEYIIVNGSHTEAVKRKIFADHTVEEASQRNAEPHSASIGCEGRSSSVKLQSLIRTSVKKTDETILSKRPRSLPDFRHCHTTEDHCVDNVVPSNGKEAAAKEEHRLKSLVSVSHGSLQKDSPVSRSLNSISDIQDHVTSFRSRPDAKTDFLPNLRNRSVQQYSPSPDAASSNDTQNTASNKKNCVRRLKLDDGGTFLQNPGSVHENGQQSLVQKETTSIGTCEQIISEKNSKKLLSKKKRQLGSFSKTGKNSNKGPVTRVRDLHTPLESMISKSVASSHAQNIPGNLDNFPEVSQQYRLGPDTQRVLMSDFEEDSFCISEKSKDGAAHPKTSLRTVQNEVEILSNAHKDNFLEISTDTGNPHISEELFPGSQCSGHSNHLEREKTAQQNRPQGSQAADLECHRFENLRGVVNTLSKELPVQPHGLRFTVAQIKSMCEVLCRLYST